MSINIVDDLTLANSAVFFRYKPKKPNASKYQKLTNTDIEKLFKFVKKKKAVTKLEAGQKVRDLVNVGNNKMHISFCWFRFESDIAFLKNNNAKETRYGFVLVAESDEVVSICKSHAPDIWPALKHKLEKIPQPDFASLFSSNDPEYEQLTLRTMTVASTEVRKKSFEAYDLKGIIPTLGAGREIPIGFKMHLPNQGSYAITPSSGRIAKSSGKSSLLHLCQWILTVEQELKKGASSQAFLSQFAQETDFSIISSLSVTSVLFDLHNLRKAVGSGKVKVLDKSGTIINSSIVNNQLNRTRKPITLKRPDKVIPRQFVRGKSKKPVIRFKENLKSFGIDFPLLKDVEIQNTSTGDKWSIAGWIRDNDEFCLAFDDVKYFYTSGKLFYNQEIISEMKSVKQILDPSLPTTINSEKGDNLKSYKKTSRKFRCHSLFRHVDDNLAKDATGLFCDDLGDEWADHIAITKKNKSNPPCIEFFHSKHGKISNGASCFQEVLGQAIKNLGRTHANANDFEAKFRKASQFWNNTKIKRIRNGVSTDNLVDLTNEVIAHPNTVRKVTVVASFMSKAGFIEQLGKPKLKPHTIQLVWQLSSFLNVCRSLGIQAKIVCMP